MSNTPHELADEFPQRHDRIQELKTGNAHFARLAEEYHTVNRAIHRAETGVESVSPVAETEMRKRRMKLKDEIAAMLAG